MAASEDLKVRFFGEDGNLRKTLNELQADLKKFEDQLRKTGNAADFQKIQQEIAKTKNAIQQLNSGQAFGNVKKGANEANVAVTNLGRVAQDSAFGFIGIANNLNPLLESFQRLKAETGSAGGAIKALGGSLMGAGGLGLALSAVTAAASFAQLGFSAWTRGLFSNQKAIEDNAIALAAFSREVEDARSSLDRLTDAIAFSNKQGKLLLELGFGKGLSTDLEDLRGQSMNNLGLLTKLNAERQKLSKKRDDATNTLLPLIIDDEQLFKAFDQNVLDQFTDKMSDNAKRAFKAWQSVESAITDVNEQIIQASQNQSGIQVQIKLTKKNIAEEAAKEAKEAREKMQQELSKVEFNFFDKFFKAFPENSDKPRQIAEMFKVATQFALENQSIFIGLDDILKADTKESSVQIARQWWEDFQRGIYKFKVEAIKVPGIRADFQPTSDAVQNVKLPPVKITAPKDGRSDILEDFKRLGESIGRSLGAGFDTEFSKLFEDVFMDLAKTGLDEDQLKKSLQSFVNTAQTISDSISNIFGDVFDALVDGEDPIKAFLNSIKQTAKQVAQELIATYIKVAVFKSLASPVSLTAGPQVFSLLKFFGFNRGGIVPGSGNTDTVPAMLTPGELIIPKEVVNQMRRGNFGGVGELLNNMNFPSSSTSPVTESRIEPGGAAVDVYLSGQFIQQGTAMVATIEQVHQTQRRNR